MTNKIRLVDYKPPAFLIPETQLEFDLHNTQTQVRSKLHIQRNPAATHEKNLVLNGEGLKLISVSLNDKALTKNDYQVTDETLTLFNVPDDFILKTVVEINPEKNLALTGLYLSSGIFCTQCESHGFRHITYFLDRPDVLSRFSVEITAENLPVILCNGNLIKEEKLSHGKKKVVWHDPTLKPCYLFALVAGKLDCLQDTFITMSGRKIDLRIYVEPGKLDQAHHAMIALKQAMKFDEETYGREYELDIYMIVAVADFNFGAMENKGLNVFNDRYILANAKTATDTDFTNVTTVVGHEYFHNWSGNRVTVSNWFQITLKEGLTVFREQTFRAAVTSEAVSRIDEVKHIRNHQFPQDSGPTAHPIQPKEYEEVNNFYTMTIYSKGAEVIRMIQTILGKDKFRKGLDYYFEKNDGKAVTTEDFIAAMEQANHVDLKQFRHWYHQAGTPLVTVKDHYDEKNHIYQLTFEQSCPATPGQACKELFFIPIRYALWAKNGKHLPVENGKEEAVLNLTQKSQTLILKNIPSKPIPSLFRDFSAPVKYDYAYTDDELLFLIQHDDDAVARWDASQIYVARQLLKAYQAKKNWQLTDDYIKTVKSLLVSNTDPALIAELITFPQISYLIEMLNEVDVVYLYQLRENAIQQLAKTCHQEFKQTYEKLFQKDYELTPIAIGQRRLRNLCLQYLLKFNEIQLADAQYKTANNMTNAIAALAALNDQDSKERGKNLEDFYQTWKNDSLVVDKWFTLQAQSAIPNALDHIKHLLSHPAYNEKNPNRVRAVVGVFANSNVSNFHAADGSGYEFVTEQVLKADQFNPQLSSRLVEPLLQWRRYDKNRQKLMKNQLEKLTKNTKLSRGLSELVHQSLAGH